MTRSAITSNKIVSEVPSLWEMLSSCVQELKILSSARELLEKGEEMPPGIKKLFAVIMVVIAAGVGAVVVAAAAVVVVVAIIVVLFAVAVVSWLLQFRCLGLWLSGSRILKLKVKERAKEAGRLCYPRPNRRPYLEDGSLKRNPSPLTC